MAATYTPIASITLGTATATVTFSSIPQTYTDLILVGSLNTTASLDYSFRLNSDTTAIYSTTRLTGNGSAASSARLSNYTLGYINALSGATGQHSFIINLMNYTNTTTYKSALVRYDNSATETMVRAHLYRSTSAISTISIQTDSSTFVTGSTFNLYGIQAGNA